MCPEIDRFNATLSLSLDERSVKLIVLDVVLPHGVRINDKNGRNYLARHCSNIYIYCGEDLPR